MKTKTINVPVSPETHADVMGIKARLGKRWPEVIEEALRLWVRAKSRRRR